MIQSNHFERVRLPSVNDIFPVPKAHTIYNPNLYHSNQSLSILHSPTPISTQHNQIYGQTIFVPNSPMGFSYIRPVSPLQNYSTVKVSSNPLTPSPIYNEQMQSPISPQYFSIEHSSYASNPNGQHYHMKNYKFHKHHIIRQSNAWSYEDDCLLKYLKEIKNLGWREISLHFKNRTANGCQFRWRRISSLSKSQTEKLKTPKESPKSFPKTLTPMKQDLEEYNGSKNVQSLSRILN